MTLGTAANGLSRANGRLLPHGSSDKTFVEFFAGIGLVDEGLRPAGWRCVYANDIDPRKHRMHETRNGPAGYYHLGDVGDTDAVISRITGCPFLATASFPCIDLSVAGHYRGIHGQHSSSFFGFTRVLDRLGQRRPKLVMLENVLGFVSSRKGEDFKTALSALAELGYWFDAFVLDAAWFVPQSRPRVFVIGMSGDLRPKRITRHLWETAEATPNASRVRPEALVRLLQATKGAAGWHPLELPPPPQRTIKLEDVIDMDDGQNWWEEFEVRRHYAMMSERHRRRVDLLLAAGVSFIGTIFRRVRRDGQRAEVRFDGLAGCLRTPRGGSGRQIVLTTSGGRLRMRWMTPREYSRLQGVPNYPLDLPTNQLLLGLADAVCVPAISWIDRHVLTPLYEAGLPAHRNGRVGRSHA